MQKETEGEEPSRAGTAAQKRFHPAERDLARFTRAELSRAEVRAIVRHLLTRCPRCSELTREFWRLGNLPLEVLAADPQENPAHLLSFEHRASRAR